MHPHISQWQNEMIEVAFAVSEPYGKYLGSSLKGTAPEEHEYITKQELSSSIEFGLSHQVPPKKSESTEDRNKNLQPEKAEDNSCKNPDLEPGTITQISKRNSHEDTSNLFTVLYKNLPTFQLKASHILNHSLKEALNYHRFGRKSEERYNIGGCKVILQCI